MHSDVCQVLVHKIFRLLLRWFNRTSLPIHMRNVQKQRWECCAMDLFSFVFQLRSIDKHTQYTHFMVSRANGEQENRASGKRMNERKNNNINEESTNYQTADCKKKKKKKKQQTILCILVYADHSSRHALVCVCVCVSAPNHTCSPTPHWQHHIFLVLSEQ